MNAESILTSDDFRQCQSFHGHLCPGLSLGYVAGKLALEWIQGKQIGRRGSRGHCGKRFLLCGRRAGAHRLHLRQGELYLQGLRQDGAYPHESKHRPRGSGVSEARRFCTRRRAFYSSPEGHAAGKPTRTNENVFAKNTTDAAWRFWKPRRRTFSQ